MKLYWKGSGRKIYIGRGIHLELLWFSYPDGATSYIIYGTSSNPIFQCLTAPILPTAVGVKEDFPFRHRM
jgi:hypothetical protein